MFLHKVYQENSFFKASALESYLTYVYLILSTHCLCKQHPCNKIAHLRFIDAFLHMATQDLNFVLV